MILFDHTTKSWLRRKRRENGAATYSKDIVAHQIQKWGKLLGDLKYSLSTCPTFYSLKKEIKRLHGYKYIQYLHMYPYSNPIGYIQRIHRSARGKILFLTAYKSFDILLKINGFNSKFTPMSIDTDKLKSYIKQDRNKNTIIYFGNIYSDKALLFNEIKEKCEANGLKLDYICDGLFNGVKPVNQQEAWDIISTYEYGVGVGRCAMEMWALGLKIMIAGNQFGGIVIDEADWAVQEKTNFNGRCITFDRDINTCIKCLSMSIQFPSVRNIATEDHTIDLDL